MMTCQEWEIWISAYHDDALDPERRRHVEAHLGTCAPCRAFSAETAALGPILHAAMTRAEAPETLFREVMMRLPETVAAKRLKPVLRPPRGWLSFGLAPIGIAIWLMMSGPPARTPPRGPIVVAAPNGGTVTPTRQTPATGIKGAKRAGEKRKSGGRPASGSPSGTTPPKVSPPSEHRPELEELRRMQQRRPPRFQDRLARHSSWRLASDRPYEGRIGSAKRSASRHRPRRARRNRPLVASNPAPTRQTTARAPIRDPESWLSVVDYVLPQAAPETTAGEGTEFVLRAAETYQVTRTSYEY